LKKHWQHYGKQGKPVFSYSTGFHQPILYFEEFKSQSETDIETLLMPYEIVTHCDWLQLKPIVIGTYFAVFVS